uniref:Uncharacterized protein n=1 Tax=Riboviria sp. TaxID=2585031 RepID=A0A8K1U216_9VIRU|nr:MAG: hypothetical protein 1 [Riboviria sp.]
MSHISRSSTRETANNLTKRSPSFGESLQKGRLSHSQRRKQTGIRLKSNQVSIYGFHLVHIITGQRIRRTATAPQFKVSFNCASNMIRHHQKIVNPESTANHCKFSRPSITNRHLEARNLRRHLAGSRGLGLRSGGGATYTLTRDNVDKMETIDTDLVAFEPDARLFSALGMTKPTFLQTLPEGRGAFCQIVGCLSRGTTGYVRHSPVFGHVEYTGTTKKGYSGAGYTVGKNLVGIHTHGGTVNGGYDITFVWAMLKYFREKKPEALDSDTAKWLETQKKNKARFVVDSQWQDLDEVRIRVNGRYHIVARDAMVDAYGPDWSTAAEVVRPGYRDLEAADPSGEANRDSFGASSSADMSAPLDGLAGRLFSQKEEQFLKKLLHFHNELKAPLKPQNS